MTSVPLLQDSRKKRTVLELTSDADSTYICGLNDAKKTLRCTHVVSESTSSTTDVISGKSRLPCWADIVELLTSAAVVLATSTVTLSSVMRVTGSPSSVKLSSVVERLSTMVTAERITTPTCAEYHSHVTLLT